MDMIKRLGMVIAVAVTLGGVAHAQGQGFAINRYEPTTAGEPSFMVDYPWYSKTRWFAGGLTLNYAHNPLTYGYRLQSDGQYREQGPIIGNQLSLHVDLAASFLDRITIAVSLPIVLFENGSTQEGISPLNGVAVGDIRLGAMARLYGQAYESKFSLHLGINVWVPFNKWPSEGESGVRVMPKLIAAGFYKGLRYSVNAAFYYRPQSSIGDAAPTAGNSSGSEIQLGGSIGYWDKARHFTIAPEVLLASVVIGGKPFQKSYTSLEALLGAHYHIKEQVWVGLAAGLGALRQPGTPDFRALLRISYAPVRHHKPVKLDGDRDHDGIPDSVDKCPDDPEDKDGFEDQDGCPDLDNDKDGIVDLKDKCPNDPEDKDGFEDKDGCPDPDNDKDDIVDLKDKCPNEPEDKDGFEDEDGCPDPDNDQDGVLDVDDACPLVPGPKENKGCPDPDRDGDMIPDRLDNCPDEPGVPEYHGCKKPQKVEIRNGHLDIIDSVYFALDKDVIIAKSFPLLDNVAQVIKAHPEIKRVLVEGHTDAQGKLAHNMDLSQRRAVSVVKYLVKQGVEAGRLDARGFGPTQPIADNKTKAGRAKNRRVVFTIVGGSEVQTKESAGPAEDTLEK